MSILVGAMSRYRLSRYRLCICCCKLSSITKTVPQCTIRECGICFNKKQIPNIKYYHCNHNDFCKSCIKNWRLRGNNCPICRAQAKVGYKYRIK